MLERANASAKDVTEYICEISFIGNLYNGEKNRLRNVELSPYATGYVEGLIRSQQQIYGYNLLRDVLQQQPQIVTEVIEKCQLRLGEEFVQDDVQLATDALGMEVSARERETVLRVLGNKYPIKWYGASKLSESLLSGYLEQKGYADYETEIPLIYQNSRINLNITSKTITSGIPQRVFDILACGGFCLTNYQPEVAEFFEDGLELVMYHSVEDLLEKVAYYLAHEEERKQIAVNGKKKLEACYELMDRVKEMLEKVGNEQELKQKQTAFGDACKGRLIFYIGQMETLDVFTRELRYAFEKLGYETFTYNLQETRESLQGLEDFCKTPVTAVITFNTMFYNLKMANGKNAWDEMGIPYITILVDHPDNFKETLITFSEKNMVFCIDRNHMNYVGRFYRNIVTYGFLPHGGTEYRMREDNIPFEKRKKDIMYAGSIAYSAPKEMQFPEYIQGKYEEFFDAKKLCKEVYKYLLSDSTKTVEDTIESILQNWGLYIDDDVLETVISDFMFIHFYILSYYRAKVLEAIANAGLELYIYGDGWKDFMWARLPNVHLMGMVTPEQVLEEMYDSKVVLSTMAWFKDGTHERVFNGLLARALVVSEGSDYMNENFYGREEDSNQELLLFELGEIDKLPARIAYMLSHAEEAQCIIERGYKKAKECHTWEARAIELSDIL